MKSATLLLCLALSITASQAVKVDGFPGLEVTSDGKSFSTKHVRQEGTVNKMPARLPARQGPGPASGPAPSAACASGSAELRLLEWIAIAAQLNTVFATTQGFAISQLQASTTCQDLEADGDCVLDIAPVAVTVGAAARELLTIKGDYSSLLGGSPNPALKLSLSASNFDTTAVSVVVVSNSYPMTPTFNLLNGMLTVYLPPYDTPVTDPELVLKFVVLTFPTTPKPCCTAANQLKHAGSVCRESPSSCKTDAVCDAVSGDCPANPSIPNNSVCPWYPGASAAYASSAATDNNPIKSVIASDGATKKVAVKTTGYGYSSSQHAPCQGRCNNGVCRLHLSRADECCSLEATGPGRSFTGSGAVASTAALREEGRQALYCFE